MMGAYSDELIFPVLLEMSEDRSITAKDVSQKMGIPHSTVRYSINRMLEMNRITREGAGRRWGYKYYAVTDSE